MLFTVKPAIALKLRVRDVDGTPTTARLQFVDDQGHVYPPQPKRLAPDLFFQKQIYRADGEEVRLPPGKFTLYYGRGPEYRVLQRTVVVPATASGGAATTCPRSICGSSAGSIRQLTVSTAAITTSMPRVAPTTPLLRRAWTRPTCSARSRERGSTWAAC